MEIKNDIIVFAEKPKKVKLTENKKEYFKNYYTEHLDKMKEYNNKRKLIFERCVICDCLVVKKHITSHYRTKKHMRHIEEQQVRDIV